MQSVLAHSGLFIGLFDRADRHHVRCRRLVREFGGSLPTTWPVLADALVMLDADGVAAHREEDCRWRVRSGSVQPAGLRR